MGFRFDSTDSTATHHRSFAVDLSPFSISLRRTDFAESTCFLRRPSAVDENSQHHGSISGLNWRKYCDALHVWKARWQTDASTLSFHVILRHISVMSFGGWGDEWDAGHKPCHGDNANSVRLIGADQFERTSWKCNVQHPATQIWRSCSLISSGILRENQGDVRARVDCTQLVMWKCIESLDMRYSYPLGQWENQTEEFPAEKSGAALQALWRHINLQPLLFHPDLWSFGLQEGPFSFHGTATRPWPCCLTGVGTTARKVQVDSGILMDTGSISGSPFLC